MADALTGETRDVMLVGHMPHIERLLRLLIDRSTDGATVFPVHGIVAPTPQNDRWVESWRLDDAPSVSPA